MSEQEPFFIGWESKPAPSLSAFLKRVSWALMAGALCLGGIITAAQRTVSTGTFEFGKVKQFSGILVKEPVPTLIAGNGTTYYLVAPLKRGFPPALAASMHLHQVELSGTFIGDELDGMIEAIPDTVRSLAEGKGATPETSSGEHVRLLGEIVDSKCHLGVMNPGRFKPHRACAIQCLSGGIPPILVLHDGQDKLAHVLLVGSDGSAINDQILDFVAEPIEVSGSLKTVGGRQVLYVDVASLRRL